MEQTRRPDIGEYFLKKASVIGERATCQRHHMGAVAVKDKHILATGYNGAPAGLKDCLTLGCLRNQLRIPSGKSAEICRAVHAEQDVIIQAGLHGVSIRGATIYCSHSPGVLCAKMLVNAQTERFVSFGRYADNEFLTLFKDAGIEFVLKERPPLSISLLD